MLICNEDDLIGHPFFVWEKSGYPEGGAQLRQPDRVLFLAVGGRRGGEPLLSAAQQR